jgi:hypothetical protein
MKKLFNPSSPNSVRAVQAWQILIGMAMRRQTITYENLSYLMYNKKAQGVLDKILGHIAFYCNENELPALTSIVVGKRRGTPGHGIPTNLLEIDKEHEKVYEYNWYDIYPPSETELKIAYKKHVK